MFIQVSNGTEISNTRVIVDKTWHIFIGHGVHWLSMAVFAVCMLALHDNVVSTLNWYQYVAVKEKLAVDLDSEIATTSLRISLICPVKQSDPFRFSQ